VEVKGKASNILNFGTRLVPVTSFTIWYSTLNPLDGRMAELRIRSLLCLESNHGRLPHSCCTFVCTAALTADTLLLAHHPIQN